MRNAELTLKEFLIAVLHRFRTVLLVGVAAAVLAGAFSAYTTRMGIGTWQEEYDVQYAAYQQALASKRTSIEDSQAIAAQAREYNQNSLLMRVDPFNKQVASLSFSVTVPPDVYSVGLPEGKTLNLVDLQASSVQAVTDRYLLLAGSADLGDVLGGVYTGDAKDSYLRELIRVGEFRAEGAPRDQGNSGIVVITATGSRGLDAKAAVDAVFAYLQRQKPLVEQSAVPHDVRVLEESVQIVSDNALAEAQNTQRSLLADNAARVIQLQQEINDLQGRRPRAPSLLFSVAQSAVLGFLLGLVLGTGVAVLAYLAQLPAHYATQMQRQLGMRFLGGAQRPARGIISRWKARLAG
ncbi:MAG TPA: hypothetical protein VLA21_01235, partial [Candidatus Limnocylindria bacterium]|nr:hypothetical protein [Candidatus Limnocylindria bacterium]